MLVSPNRASAGHAPLSVDPGRSHLPRSSVGAYLLVISFHVTSAFIIINRRLTTGFD